MENLPAQELTGVADFPSIWNQARKRGLQLHWDGNNDKVEERNLSAAFGTGATPTTIDHAAVGRVEAWAATAEPPPFAASFPVDAALAARGEPIYARRCAGCHGKNGQDFSGDWVGKVTPIAEIGTDPFRLQSYTQDLAVNQGSLYAGDPPYRFTHFRKTFGYANMPLDGLWLRAPYLHNGSVPTLWDLLQPVADRPKVFYRGNDVYDPKRLGFVADLATQGERRFFKFDTGRTGNANTGHAGPAYGTDLPADDKWALVEYLKTF
jgi:mono/diheme cytochrome c family protein